MALKQIASVPIPKGERPGFDHADVYHDPNGPSRIYVAHTGADRVDVIDCSSKVLLRSLPNHPGIAGVLCQGDRLFTSNRQSGQVAIYRCSDDTALGRVDTGRYPNGLAFDHTRGNLYVFDAGDPPGTDSAMFVIDIAGPSLIHSAPLPGQARWAVYDAESDRVYANIREPAVIAVFEAATWELVDTLRVPSAGPHGLAMVGDRLFCATDGADLIVLQRDSGAVQQSLALPGVPDVIMHDAELGRAYVAIGSPGVVLSIDSETLTMMETVVTEQGAHTFAWDAVSKCLYAFLPQSSRALVFQDS